MPAKAKAAAPAKTNAKAGAAKATAAAKKVTVKRSRPVRTSAVFRRPHTRRTESNPKYPRELLSKPLDAFRIIRYPSHTEAALKMVEERDTIVFIVDPRANKKQIKEAVKKLYEIKSKRVNTLIKPDGTKKAFVKIDPSQETLEIASKIGLLS
eukprot:TRINITY_DN83988_c0_g1_i1.p1 TRINITY_DN83988_c0_g1~~TRINITY_DN83988_c0_g1_i1.p1  ORF type:complete len:153 (-),score=34.87 TRINITY_DN83988_c0_g1_i1:17-475(-)